MTLSLGNAFQMIKDFFGKKKHPLYFVGLDSGIGKIDANGEILGVNPDVFFIDSFEKRDELIADQLMAGTVSTYIDEKDIGPGLSRENIAETFDAAIKKLEENDAAQVRHGFVPEYWAAQMQEMFFRNGMFESMRRQSLFNRILTEDEYKELCRS